LTLAADVGELTTARKSAQDRCKSPVMFFNGLEQGKVFTQLTASPKVSS
jgi:hypothetical protein